MELHMEFHKKIKIELKDDSDLPFWGIHQNECKLIYIQLRHSTAILIAVSFTIAINC
jgi:hypothetical protein